MLPSLIPNRSLPPSQASSKRANFQFKKPLVIVNKAAAAKTEDITEPVKIFFERYGYVEPDIHIIAPNKLEERLRLTEEDGTDLLVILGGDGTCRAGAITARKAGITLIALPGGTMNMLPKALYGTHIWQEALEIALSQTSPRWQPAGMINQKLFFCGAFLGEPIIMSKARESLRNGEIVDAMIQVPDILNAITDGQEFRYKADGKSFDTCANTLQIFCPFMSSGAIDENRFELASAPQLALSNLASLGALTLADDWRSHKNVVVNLAEKISITGQGGFDILLDGETDHVACPIDIRLQKEGVMVLAPNLNATETT